MNFKWTERFVEVTSAYNNREEHGVSRDWRDTKDNFEEDEESPLKLLFHNSEDDTAFTKENRKVTSAYNNREEHGVSRDWRDTKDNFEEDEESPLKLLFHNSEDDTAFTKENRTVPHGDRPKGDPEEEDSVSHGDRPKGDPEEEDYDISSTEDVDSPADQGGKVEPGVSSETQPTFRSPKSKRIPSPPIPKSQTQCSNLRPERSSAPSGKPPYLDEITGRPPLHGPKTKYDVKGLLKNKFLLIAIGILLLGVCYHAYLSFYYVSNEKYDVQISKAPFWDKMNKRYPNQPVKLFKAFSRIVNISKSSNRNEELNSVFTLLHNSETHKTAISIAQDMAAFAAEQFHYNTNVHELHGSSMPTDFGSKSYIDELKVILNNVGAMVVYDLHKINAEKAQKLHAICDKFTPFVHSHLAIILLLKTPMLKQDFNLDGKELIATARKTMEKLWNDMEKSSLDALITRLTDVVLQIKS